MNRIRYIDLRFALPITHSRFRSIWRWNFKGICKAFQNFIFLWYFLRKMATLRILKLFEINYRHFLEKVRFSKFLTFVHILSFFIFLLFELRQKVLLVISLFFSDFPGPLFVQGGLHFIVDFVKLLWFALKIALTWIRANNLRFTLRPWLIFLFHCYFFRFTYMLLRIFVISATFNNVSSRLISASGGLSAVGQVYYDVWVHFVVLYRAGNGSFYFTLFRYRHFWLWFFHLFLSLFFRLFRNFWWTIQWFFIFCVFKRFLVIFRISDCFLRNSIECVIQVRDAGNIQIFNFLSPAGARRLFFC